MDKSAVLSEDEIHCLEMVFNGNFTNLASAPNDSEAMVLKGYIFRKPLVLIPMRGERRKRKKLYAKMNILRLL